VLLKSLAAIDGLVDQPLADGATILGVHLEGPFLNQHRTGAQDVRLIRPAQMERARELLDFGFVRLLALAPEIPENIPLIDECVRRGVTVSAAHTEAGLKEMQVAVAHGLRQVTHCFNAMVGLGHREIGTVGAAMSLPELNVELIADNVHVHPRVQKILYEIKGRDRLILVTDAIRGTGLPDGDYPIDERTIHIENGEVRLPDGTIAGSVLTVNRALAHLTENTGRSLLELWPTSSLNAARAIGAAGRKGSLEVGKDADLVLIEPDFGVWRTLVGGRTVYAA
jgi:N-acetylglucosamine-6-phosphate deacetylase